MIRLHVMGIALDTRTGTPIVVLNDDDNRRALPIWIGTAEASAIIRQLENIKSTRPMTHDLMMNTIVAMGYSLMRVEINELNTDTYYASLYFSGKDNVELMIDSRPSDAIALALRADAPIFATTNVVVEGTISTDQERDAAESAEFHSFVQNVKPSDFTFPKETEQDCN
jgi:uncharacterized protein